MPLLLLGFLLFCNKDSKATQKQGLHIHIHSKCDHEDAQASGKPSQAWPNYTQPGVPQTIQVLLSYLFTVRYFEVAL